MSHLQQPKRTHSCLSSKLKRCPGMAGYTLAEDRARCRHSTYAGNEILCAYCRRLVIVSALVLGSVHAAMTT